MVCELYFCKTIGQKIELHGQRKNYGCKSNLSLNNHGYYCYREGNDYNKPWQ